MSTETQEKKEKGRALSVVKDLNELTHGSWQLKYKLTNARGLDGFAGIMLENYIDPVTKTLRKYVDNQGRIHHGIWIGEIVTTITPKTDAEAAKKLDFIIGHPNVNVQKKHVNTAFEYLNNKKSNPRFTLTNLDFEDITDIENADYIDRLLGRLSRDQGKTALGIEKLRWILATLNVSYRYPKYYNDKNKEKLKLREVLKTYVKKNRENAEEVYGILDQLDEAKFNWEVKEMLRYNILDVENGAFSYRPTSGSSNLLASTFVGLKEYLQANPDFYMKLKKRLFEKLEADSLA